MLNSKELRYFNSLKDYVTGLFSIDIGIYPLDHKTYIPMAEDEEVLGCCHKVKDDDGNTLGYFITIDEPYIKVCYYGRQTEYSPYSDNQLIETICHELAHLYVWGHNDDHKILTNELYDFVIESLALKNNLKIF